MSDRDRCRHRRGPARLGHQGVRPRRFRHRRRQLPRSARRAAGVLPARRRPHRVRQQDVPLLRPQRAGRPADVRGGVEAVSAARRRGDRAADLRHRPAPHRYHGAAPAADGRPRHQGLELWLAEFPQPRPPRETWSQNPVFQQLDAQFTKAHNENPEYMGLHYMTADEVEECWQLLRQSLHSVSYETLAHLPDLLAVAGRAGLDEAVSAAPSEPAVDRAQRRREALGAQESQPSVRARRADGDLPGCAGRAVPPAGGDASWRRCARWPSTPPRAGRTRSSAS